MRKIKNYVLALLVLIIILKLCVYQELASYSALIGVISNIILSFIVHKFIGQSESFKYTPYSDFTNVFILFITPDYIFANNFKPTNDKEKRKQYIVVANYLNLIITSIFFIIMLVIDIKNNLLFNNIKFLLLFRTISRSIEIIIAFTNDTLKNTIPKSNLNKFERIFLAVHSYFDILLMYSILYYCFNFSTDINTVYHGLIYSFCINTVTNIGIFDYKTLSFFKSTLIFLQVFTVMTLVVVSFAIYASREDPDKINIDIVSKDNGVLKNIKNRLNKIFIQLFRNIKLVNRRKKKSFPQKIIFSVTLQYISIIIYIFIIIYMLNFQLLENSNVLYILKIREIAIFIMALISAFLLVTSIRIFEQILYGFFTIKYDSIRTKNTYKHKRNNKINKLKAISMTYLGIIVIYANVYFTYQLFTDATVAMKNQTYFTVYSLETSGLDSDINNIEEVQKSLNDKIHVDLKEMENVYLTTETENKIPLKNLKQIQEEKDLALKKLKAKLNYNNSIYTLKGMEDRIIESYYPNSTEKNIDNNAILKSKFIKICNIKDLIKIYFNDLYFSSISILTVGYGDVLPNGLISKALVISEILIGQLIIIVGIGLIFTE